MKKSLGLIATLLAFAGCNSDGTPVSRERTPVPEGFETLAAATPSPTPTPSPSPSPSASPSGTPNLNGTWKYQYEWCSGTVTSLPYNHYLGISGTQLVIRTRVSDGTTWCAGSNPSMIEDLAYDGSNFQTTPQRAYDYSGNCANPTLNFVTGPQTANETYLLVNPTTLVIYSATPCGVSGQPKRTYYFKQ